MAASSAPFWALGSFSPETVNEASSIKDKLRLLAPLRGCKLHLFNVQALTQGRFQGGAGVDHGHRQVADTMDLLDIPQLARVIRCCRKVPTLSAAGCLLFAQPRQHKTRPNNADMLCKYLARFGLSWERVREA